MEAANHAGEHKGLSSQSKSRLSFWLWRNFLGHKKTIVLIERSEALLRMGKATRIFDRDKVGSLSCNGCFDFKNLLEGVEMKKLQGKVAVVTGGTTGIGLATAKLFHAEGAKVFVTGRNEKTLSKAKEELPAEVTVLKSDAGVLADIDQLFTQLKMKTDGIDVLFVNAGIGLMKSFDATTEADFDTVVGINMKGPFFTVQKAVPLLRQGASVVLTSSVAATTGMTMMTVYSASKAALRSLGRTLAADLAERGIRVNILSPGPVDTPIFKKGALPQETLNQIVQAVTQRVALHRFGEPDEVAKAALFLASDDSSYLVGAELVVDGGYLVA